MTSTLHECRPVGHVYLAGPDVFYPDPLALAAVKKETLARHGLEGHFPMDTKLDTTGKSPEAVGLEIARGNEAMMRYCDIFIANMEPWHGPSMDVGTAYEMGFGRALGKIIIGYTPDQRPFPERVREFLIQQQPLHPEWTGEFRMEGEFLFGPDGKCIETFGQLTENLMMINAIVDSGASMTLPATFEEAAQLAERLWNTKNAGSDL